MEELQLQIVYILLHVWTLILPAKKFFHLSMAIEVSKLKNYIYAILLILML